jgi:hypothetical protein
MKEQQLLKHKIVTRDGILHDPVQRTILDWQDACYRENYLLGRLESPSLQMIADRPIGQNAIRDLADELAKVRKKKDRLAKKLKKEGLL